MQQKVLIVTPINLFEIVNGKTLERGNCACAIVALPTDRPKYSLVCYNDSRETLCVGALSSNNEHSIQFELQASMYASFRDSTGKRWSCMFLKSSQVDSFLAVLGIAAYALAGQPANNTVINDFAPPAGEVRIGLQHRVKIRYSVFAIRKGDVLQLGELLETNGDRPYNFQPVQSVMALHPEAKGFESSVLGMVEDSWRAVVVPATLSRSLGGKHLYGGDSVVFVLQVVRILHDDAPMTAEGKVPMVFAGDAHTTALVPVTNRTMDANGTKIVVLHSEQRERVTSLDGSFHSVTTSGAEGSGLPAEHMAMVQKLAVQVNKATVDARDIRDLTLGVAGEWKQSVDRPKPSVLTNAALEQSVKQLIMENERVAEDITRRDELLRALDQRNRELQKRVDSAALVSQQLMDEKNDSIRLASDTKLEKERALMKLQEQINQAAHERDDTQRHLQTLKKLLEVSDEELRQVRGKADVHNIQAQGIMGKLDTIQDALAEERSRRKGLEAKVIALQEEITDTEAELHMKTAQLEDIRRMADIERAHHAQIMEDERQRRGYEAQQLRSEIVTELQMRDAKYQADRARAAEDNFKRGQEEGREIGKREARIDVETQLEELRLDAQRALTEVDASKTELRRVTENGMAQNRTLSATVTELKKKMYEETRKKVMLEYQLFGLRAKVRCAPDNVMAAFTSVVYRLRRPVKVVDLLQLLDAMKQRQRLDFSFEERDQAAEEKESMQRRLGWIEAEMMSLYRDRCEAIYSAWVEPLAAEQKVTVETVHRLRLERDGVAHYELDAAETRERFEIGQEMEAFFNDLSAFFWDQMRQRRQCLDEAERVLTGMLKEYIRFVDLLSAYRLDELQARQRLSEACMTVYTALVEEETSAFQTLLREALTGMNVVVQNAVIETEEGERAAIDADQCSEFSGILFDYRKSLAVLLRAAAAAEERRTLMVVEAQSRDIIFAEEQEAAGNIAEAHVLLLLSPPPPPPLSTTVEVESSEGASSIHQGPVGDARDGVTVEEKTTLVAAESQVETGRVELSKGDASTDSNPAASLPPPPPPPAAATTAKRDVLFRHEQRITKPKDISSSSDDDDDDYTVRPRSLAGKVVVDRRVPLRKPRLFDSSDSD